MGKDVPAYLRVRQSLIDFIRNASEVDDAQPIKIPSEKKLCEHHGVSRPTVRRAISSLVEDGMLEPRRGMGTFVLRDRYEAHDRRARADIDVGVGFYAAQFAFPMGTFEWEIYNAIIRHLRAQGAKVIMVPILGKGLLAAEELASQDLAGMLWIGPEPDSIEIIRALRRRGVETVVVNRTLRPERVHYVTNDHAHGGYLAARHLLELGHRRILFAPMPEDAPSYLHDRYEGFCRAHEERGLCHDPGLILHLVTGGRSGPAPTANAALRRRLADRRDFSAIFVPMGMTITGLVQVLRNEGVRIPEDLSIVSYDRTPPLWLGDLQLVQVLQPLEEMGRRAAQGMLDIVAGTQKNTLRITLQPHLADGDSVRPLNASRAPGADARP